MNNQVKLIDADKLLSWLSSRMSGTGSDSKYFAYESVQEAVEAGEFAPDPVPTIKPGDKVKHPNILEPVKVVHLGKEVAVIGWMMD